MREIAIFRHNLFKISEPFITQQALHLQRHKPLYVGRLRYGAPPAGADALALQDIYPRWTLPRVGWQMLTRNPAPYVRLLGERRPILIHAHFGIEGVYALPIARRLGIPLITTFHGFDATLSTPALLTSPAWANYPLFRHRLAAQGDLFLCASGFIRERVLALGFPEARTSVHYIGVDCRAIRPRDPAEETRTIVHVGRLVAVKGAKYLIEAFKPVAAAHQDVALIIIGEGPLQRSLESLVISLGLAGRVRFLGAMPHADVLGWIRQAAMLVLPSVETATGRIEGLGMVMLEAAACGVPVVGSRIGGIPEGIVDGETGFLAPERDAAALAGCMDTLLCQPDLRRRMGRAARSHVEARFDLHRQTERLERHYDTLAPG